jgi:inorganic pyrophosphatase
MKIDAGEDAPNVVNALIEIPMGSDVKYEFNEDTRLIKVDRILFTAMHYPLNYGSIPGTMSKDGDPLDVLVLCDKPFYPYTYIEVIPIGVLKMKDEAGQDFKIIAVPKAKVDPTYADIRDIKDVGESLKKKIVHFFEHMKELEPNKWVKVTGWGSAVEAKKSIKAAIRMR